MRTICILKIYSDRNYYNGGDDYDDVLKLLQHSDWIEVNDNDLYDIRRGLQYLPRKDNEQYVIFSKPQEPQSKLIEITLQGLKDEIANQKAELKAREKEQILKKEADKLKKEAKKKQKELLKKATPEVIERLLKEIGQDE